MVPRVGVSFWLVDEVGMGEGVGMGVTSYAVYKCLNLLFVVLHPSTT